MIEECDDTKETPCDGKRTFFVTYVSEVYQVVMTCSQPFIGPFLMYIKGSYIPNIQG